MQDTRTCVFQVHFGVLLVRVYIVMCAYVRVHTTLESYVLVMRIHYIHYIILFTKYTPFLKGNIWKARNETNHRT